MIPIRDIIPSRTRPVVTVALIAVNLLVFAYQVTLMPRETEAFVYAFGLVPAQFSLMHVLTSMFVHGGLAHVGGNMLYLWIFGDNVEDRLGHGRFLGFYVGAGAAAAVAQTLFDPSSTVPMVGASGAIAGVMGGYFVLYPESRVLTLFPFPLMLFEVPAVFFLGLWFVVQFLNGLGSLASSATMPGGVAFWAHVVGFAAGYLFVRVLRRPVEW
jgi:membrane associated rhomboid family serine protease